MLEVHTSGAPISNLDIFSMDAILNPDQYDEVLREMAPIVYLSKYAMFVTGRHDLTQTILGDDEQFSAKKRPFFEPASIRADILITDDLPDHSKPRSVIQRALSPKVMRELSEHFKADAERLVAEKMSNGTIELEAREDLVGKFVLKVFPDALGLRADGRENLLSYGDVVFNTFGPENQLYHDALNKAGPVLEWVMSSCQAENIKKGGIARQMYDAADEGIITQREAELLVLSLLSAGTDSTIMSMMNILYAFSQFPEQWQQLRKDPSLVRGVLEEGLRYESITRFLGRGVNSEIELAGVTIPADAKIGCLMYAVGRDPRRWEEAEQFDIKRRVVGHLGLGTGIHACVGQSIARLEAESLFTALAKHVERIELIGEPRPTLNNIAHGAEYLPLRLHAV